MNEPDELGIDSELLAELRSAAHQADACQTWPDQSWAALRRIGALAWCVPCEYGGAGWATCQLLAGYEQLAKACLTTAFILSQREGAVRRLAASANLELARRFLPGLAAGPLRATVGLSQLTTSGQHRPPSLVAAETPTGFRLDGITPWVTAADRADLIVVGATFADGRQILVGCPGGQLGVTIEPPMPLMALAGSCTSAVRFAGVTLAREWLIEGPGERIMGGKPGGVGGLETSSLALGLAGAAIDFVQNEAVARSDLEAAARRLNDSRLVLRSRLFQLAATSASQESVLGMRVGCTMLALEASQIALTAAKGTGFVAPHPVQRWARQALFFLVWSCPRPAAEGLIGRLLPGAIA